MLELDDIRAAAGRIAGNVVRTPLLPSERLGKQLGCSLHFKCENLQATGAFKARGACNAVQQLDTKAAERGVVTHSSGNHAAALARAAAVRGIAAYVVMPDDSAQVKVRAVESYGVQPVFCPGDTPSRQQAALDLQQRTGATLVHPFDNYHVMAGQGTVGLEILEQLANVDVVLVPVGGGGLLSGVLVSVKLQRPEVQVIAVEPQLADDAARSLSAGQIALPERYDSIADGLRSSLGQHTFPLIEKYVDDIILVSEQQIVAATRDLCSQVHLIAEPSGAVTLAGLCSQSERFQGKNVVAIISGGNLDANWDNLLPS